jgi:polar amino acid transport system substrate-binding protein
MAKITRKAFVSGLFGVLAALLPLSAVAETTLERIKRTGEMTVATEAAFPPFEFVQDGKIVGYGKDILDEVVADLGVKLNQLDLPFQGILPGLLAGKFDFIATSIGVTEERATKYAYTVPIADSTSYFLKRADDTSINSGEDLNGKVVGTQLASLTEQVAKDYDAKLKAAGGTGIADLKLYPSFPESYVALANGEIDVAVLSLPNAALLIRDQPGVFALAGPAQEGKRWMGWVTRPEDTDLRDYLSSVILELRDNGKLYQFQDKWFGFKMEIPDSGYLPEGAL